MLKSSDQITAISNTIEIHSLLSRVDDWPLFGEKGIHKTTINFDAFLRKEKQFGFTFAYFRWNVLKVLFKQHYKVG